VQEQPRHTTWQQGLTTGLKDPSGKGGRWIILHAGSSSGFVDNGLLIFQSKKSGDYHEEMNSDCFQTWFAEQLLPNIEPSSVIVIDNAPYHSKKIDKVPTTATRKAEIQQWLKDKNIAYEDDLLKAELLQIVRTHKHLYGDYVVDQMARQAGHTVRQAGYTTVQTEVQYDIQSRLYYDYIFAVKKSFTLHCPVPPVSSQLRGYWRTHRRDGEEQSNIMQGFTWHQNTEVRYEDNMTVMQIPTKRTQTHNIHIHITIHNVYGYISI
jgi:hypothetical protein